MLGAKEIFIGSNYLFGKGKKGSPELLKKMGKKCGFKVTVLDDIKIKDSTVSSSRIRALVAKGKVDEVSQVQHKGSHQYASAQAGAVPRTFSRVGA